MQFLQDQIYDATHLGVTFPARHFWRVAGRPVFKSHIRGAGSFEIRCRSTDAKVVRQIFREREYDFSGRPHFAVVQAHYQRSLDAGQTPLILDIGANIGASTVWFAGQYPAAHIIAVEPDPDNAEMCRRNTAHLPNVSVIQAAIGGAMGAVTLTHREDGWAVRTVRSEGGDVPVCTIAHLIAGEGPESRLLLVKIDIEGFESDLFEGDLQWMNGVRAILIEPHDWMLPGRHTSRSFQRAMAAHDFEMLLLGENLIYVAYDEEAPSQPS